MGKLYDLERRIEQLEEHSKMLNELKKFYLEYQEHLSKPIVSEIKINPEVVKQLPNKEGN